ncbi:MAG: class I SAM-dependent methyltransferase [Gammaproteobacteria bacterium]|nr:MAG: class I SAM-dependent methyltransferase [Gammaproteobacteria bacterium]
MRAPACEESTAAPPERLREWLPGAAGRRLIAAEEALLRRFVEGLFGYYLVSVEGLGADLRPLHECPVRHKLRLAPSEEEGGDIVARAEQLPLRSDTIDAVVLHHSLDFSADPHLVLREVERVLIAEGRVVILGFNPFSLWGVWRLLLRGRSTGPWCGHFLSYRRVVDWLGLLGFDVEYTDVAAFVPPLPQRWEGRFAGVERLARRYLPMFAGVYVIRAVKRVSTVTPVRLRWQALRVFSPSGAMEPTAGRQNMGKGARR